MLQLNKNSLWAPLVNLRTYHLDFRPHFLFVPDDFDRADIEKFRPFYNSASAKLPDIPDDTAYWCAVATERHFIVGVICYTRALNNTMTRHVQADGTLGRWVYGFFGYVSKRASRPSTLPKPRFEDFASLFDKIIPTRWLDTAETPGWQEPQKLPYAPQSWPSATNSAIALNSDPSVVQVFPVNQTAQAWSSILQCTETTSFCSGPLLKDSAETAPYANIAFPGSDSRKLVRLIKSAPENRDNYEAVPPPNDTKSEPQRFTVEEFRQQRQQEEKKNPSFVVYLLGAAVALLALIIGLSRSEHP